MKRATKPWTLFVRLEDDERRFWQQYAVEQREPVSALVRRLLRKHQTRVEKQRQARVKRTSA